MAVKELYKTLGQAADVSLLARTGTEKEIGVALNPGSGLILRGTVIQKGANGLYTPAKTGAMASGECAVLIHDEETGAEASGVAPTASAYKAGRFLRGKLILAEGELTDADLLELRRQGITVDGESATVNNAV